jgi:hypothetical protein
MGKVQNVQRWEEKRRERLLKKFALFMINMRRKEFLHLLKIIMMLVKYGASRFHIITSLPQPFTFPLNARRRAALLDVRAAAAAAS